MAMEEKDFRPSWYKKLLERDVRPMLTTSPKLYEIQKNAEKGKYGRKAENLMKLSPDNLFEDDIVPGEDEENAQEVQEIGANYIKLIQEDLGPNSEVSAEAIWEAYKEKWSKRQWVQGSRKDDYARDILRGRLLDAQDDDSDDDSS